MLPGSQETIKRSRPLSVAIILVIACAALGLPREPAVADPAPPHAITIWGGYPGDSYIHTHRDSYVPVCVSVDTTIGPPIHASEFDFRVCYSEISNVFVEAHPGEGLPIDWEYFTYRTVPVEYSCVDCPTNTIRLFGVASLNGPSTGFSLSGCLIELYFYVNSNDNFSESCQFVGFCALDCTDNTLRSAAGDTVFMPLDLTAPGMDYNPDSCQAAIPGNLAVERSLVFTNGALCRSDPPSEPGGGINLNSIYWEVGDAVLFANYFVYGDDVWDPTWGDLQRWQTDINQDGLYPNIADLVLLIWVICGHPDWPPPNPPYWWYPKRAVTSGTVAVTSTIEDGYLTVRTDASVGISGIHLVYHHSSALRGKPEASLPPGIVMGSSDRNGELRIAIYPDLQNPGLGYPAGSNEILSVPIDGPGEMELVTAQFSDVYGQAIEAKIVSASLPDRFSLNQNYPNPFNASTVIHYSLQQDAWVSLEIVDILGRTVARPVDEFQSAGAHECAWRGTDSDGRSVASGMYFYRLSVGDRVLTKKMVLLK